MKLDYRATAGARFSAPRHRWHPVLVLEERVFANTEETRHHIHRLILLGGAQFIEPRGSTPYRDGTTSAVFEQALRQIAADAHDAATAEGGPPAA